MYEFTIGGKSVSVFFSAEPDAPMIYLNTYSDEGRQVFQAAQAAGCPLFTLVTIDNLDWNRDMAPWDSPAAFKNGEPFTAGADDYLRLLVEEILPRAEKDLIGTPAWRGIVGYSLAGLFPCTPSTEQTSFPVWAAYPAPYGFPDGKSTSLLMSQSGHRTAHTSRWGIRRARPVIQF